MRAKGAVGDESDLISNITWVDVTSNKRGSFLKGQDNASHRLSDAGTASSGASYATNSSKRISAIMDRLLGKAKTVV